MKIYLDESDAPNPADRDTARQIIEEIITHDVLTTGSFCLEGYSAARRIAKALVAARADERRRGFDTPMPMREIAPAPGAAAVMAKWPALRPLHHWMTIEGIKFQTYKSDKREALISDDARIILRGAGEIWHVSLDGKEVVGPTFQTCFESAETAVRQTIKRGYDFEMPGPWGNSPAC